MYYYTPTDDELYYPQNDYSFNQSTTTNKEAQLKNLSEKIFEPLGNTIPFHYSNQQNRFKFSNNPHFNTDDWFEPYNNILSFKNYNSPPSCSSHDNSCNKAYMKYYGVCSHGQCKQEYNEMIKSCRNVMYRELFGIQKNGSVNLGEPNTVLQRLRECLMNELKNSEDQCEFENYIYMVLSIIFTDHQSMIVDYITSDENQNEKLSDLTFKILNSNHWNHRYLSHYNPSHFLMLFENYLKQTINTPNDSFQNAHIILTQSLIEHYTMYYSNQNQPFSFCPVSLTQTVIEMCYSLFSGVDSRYDKWSMSVQKQWEYICSNYYNQFISFLNSIWDQNDSNLKMNKTKYHRCIMYIVDIIKESKNNLLFYTLFSRLNKKISSTFSELVLGKITYQKEGCMIGKIVVPYKDSGYNELICDYVSILMNRTSTNCIFFLLNRLGLENKSPKNIVHLQSKSPKPIAIKIQNPHMNMIPHSHEYEDSDKDIRTTLMGKLIIKRQ